MMGDFVSTWQHWKNSMQTGGRVPIGLSTFQVERLERLADET